MKTLTIKRECYELIDAVEDNQLLQTFYDLLNKQKEDALRAERTRRAELAEEDIKAGRVYTPEQFKDKIKEYVLSKNL